MPGEYKMILVILIFSGLLFFVLKSYTRQWKKVKEPFPDSWRNILHQHVNFYLNLSQEKRKLFELKVHEFLLNTRIIGIKTNVGEKERVLIAAGAVIPILAFPDWKYHDLKEVLVYDDSFDHNYQTESEKNNILGMVGSGIMNGKMLLSKKAINHGFRNDKDKGNTVIHEFVHLIDSADGNYDGIPKELIDNSMVLPWIELIDRKILEIKSGESDIRDYGASNRVEFFSVAAEYFFERPTLMKEKEPELYSFMEMIFDQDKAYKFKVLKSNKKTGRNDPCPCGSGKKFKKCCLRN